MSSSQRTTRQINTGTSRTPPIVSSARATQEREQLMAMNRLADAIPLSASDRHLLKVNDIIG